MKAEEIVVGGVYRFQSGELRAVYDVRDGLVLHGPAVPYPVPNSSEAFASWATERVDTP